MRLFHLGLAARCSLSGANRAVLLDGASSSCGIESSRTDEYLGTRLDAGQ